MSAESKTLNEMKAEGEGLRRELYRFKAVKEENRQLREALDRQAGIQEALEKEIAGRRKTTEELRVHQEYLNTLFEGSKDPIIGLDRQRRILKCNRAFFGLFGFTAEEILGRSTLLIHRDQEAFEAFGKMIYPAIREAGSWRGEWEFKKKDGTVIPLETMTSAIRQADGAFTGYVSIMQDVSHRRAAQRRQRRERIRNEILLDLYRKSYQLTDRQLYDEVLDQAVKLTDSRIGFFHQVGDDQRSIILTTWNEEALRTCSACYEKHYPIEKAGNWVDCVHLKRPVVYNDFSKSPHQKGLPAGHTPVERFMSIPVFEGEKVRLIFGVGNKEKDYDDDDRISLQLVANELFKILARRKAEQTLNDHELKVRALLDAAPDIALLLDPRGTILAINGRGAERLKTPVEDLIGRNIARCLPEGVFRERMAQLEKVVAVKKPLRFEDERDGFFFEHYLTPILDSEGQVDSIAIYALEVTDRKKSEESLKNSEVNLRILLENTPQVFILLTPEGIIRAFNPLADNLVREINGRGLQEGDRLRDSIPEEHLEFFDANFQIARTGNTSVGERRVVGPEGRIYWFQISFSPVRDDGGRVIGVTYNALDIRESKEATQALRESEIRYRDLVEGTENLITTVDDEGRFLFLNYKALEVFGLTPKETLGRSAFDFIHPDDREETREWFQRTIALRRERAGFENRQMHQNGEVRDFLWNCRFHYDDGGNLIRVNGVAQDITERKQSEKEREIAVGFLRSINEAPGREGLIRNAVEYIRQQTGLEAVGIRLREGDDYPYCETRGFPDDFVRLEKRLCQWDAQGNVVRDEVGNPVLECMCGNVIRGRFDPAKPFFTSQGSFWTNSTTDLLASTTEADRRARTRNRCHGEGYESVALIPLRTGEESYGLLQLNDRRRGRFTPGMIALWERLAGYLAVAVGKSLSEESLRASEERFRLLLNNANDIIYVHSVYPDRAGEFLEVNDLASELMGYSREEFLQMGIPDIEVPEHKPRVPDILRELEATGKARFETENLTKDGRRIPVEVSTRMFDLQGKPTVLSVVRDISERRLSEKALRHSEAKYRALYEGAAIGIFHSTLEGRFLDVNPALAQMLGYDSPEEVVRSIHSISDQIYVNPPRRDEVIAEMLARGQTVRVENRYRRRDGSEWDAYLTLRQVQDSSGQLLYLEGFVEDISERKRTESALLASEEKFRRIVETANEGIWAMDAGRLTTFVNYKMAAMLGYEPEEMLGRSVDSFMFEEDLPEHRRRMEAREKGADDYYERQFRRKDGTSCWCLVSATALKDRQGNFAGSFAMFTDITDRKAADENLARSGRLLESIREIQTNFIIGSEVRNIFRKMLDVLVDLTKSEYGFIDEVLIDEDGALYKLSLALSDIAWNEESRNLYRILEERNLRFPHLNNLAGLPALTRTIIIANEVAADPRSGPLPPGHPPLRTYLGVPLFFGQELVGVIGLANRQEGYSEELARFLQPLLGTCAALIHAFRLDYQEQERKKALQSSEERFRQLAENIRDVFWMGSPDWKEFNYVSPAYEEIWGRTPESLYENPHSWMDPVPEEDRRRLQQEIRNKIAGDFTSPEFSEYRIVRPDGRTAWIKARAYPVFDGTGSLIRIVGMAEDVTESRTAQEQLNQSIREKELLLRELHHRVKNNLQVISSLLGLQMKEINDPRVAAAFGDSRDRIRSMALVHEALYQTTDLIRIDGLKYVRDIVTNLQTSYEQAAANVEVDVQGEAISLGMDQAVPFGLLLNELAINVFKHAFPDGGPGRLQITMTRSKEGQACLALADTGIGLPPHLDVQKTTTLGLQLVNMLVRQLDGGMDVERAGGTIFTITFPVKE